MPRKTLGGIMSIAPNPAPVGVETEFTIDGLNFPDGPVNFGARGETSWVDGAGVWATGTSAGGVVQATYTRTFPYTGIVEVEARAPGSGKKTPGGVSMPDLIARVDLVIQ